MAIIFLPSRRTADCISGWISSKPAARSTTRAGAATLRSFWLVSRQYMHASRKAPPPSASASSPSTTAPASRPSTSSSSASSRASSCPSSHICLRRLSSACARNATSDDSQLIKAAARRCDISSARRGTSSCTCTRSSRTLSSVCRLTTRPVSSRLRSRTLMLRPDSFCDWEREPRRAIRSRPTRSMHPSRNSSSAWFLYVITSTGPRKSSMSIHASSRPTKDFPVPGGP